MKALVNIVFTIMLLTITSQASIANNTVEDFEGAWLGTMDIPNGPTLRIGIEVFQKADKTWGGNIASLDQGARYMLVSSVKVEDELFTLQMADAPVSVVGKLSLDKTVIDANFNQNTAAFKLVLNKTDALPDIERKQTPVDTTSYLQQEVRYQNAVDGTWLSGTLTMPKGNNQHPAIMLVAGSGPNHRDSYHAGHRTFKVLADHFTKLGYAVLRADKRGVYKSSGNFNDASIKNLVLDTESAIQFMKSHPRVDDKKIILIGHSEGSLVSIMATENQAVDGIVSLAGPGMSVLDILLLQDQTEPAAKGATKAETDVLLAFSKRFYAMVLATPSSDERKKKALALYESLEGNEADAVEKWVNKNNGTLSIPSAESDTFYTFLQQTPIPSWEKYSGKVLILNGNKDSQVPAQENIDGIVQATNSNRSNVEAKIYDDLNHLFQPAVTGSVDEYREIEETIDEEVLSDISNWLQSNFAIEKS